MIPYFTVPSLHVGPLTFHLFGFIAAIGWIHGAWMGARIAEREHKGGAAYFDMQWTLIPITFIVAHLFDTVFYYPEKVTENPWYLLNIGAGISSLGGMIGGVVGVWEYTRRKKLPFWAFLDDSCRITYIGMAWGRLGCTIVHDHPGLPTNFFLGVQYPDGVRHDLGLYELLYLLLLNVIVFGVFKARKMPLKFWTGVFFASYSAPRFFLDFLRTADKTWGGLTGAQYMCIVAVLGGGYLIWRSLRPGAPVVELPPETKAERREKKRAERTRANEA